ncbi:MAG: hypothetical protein HZC40_11750 [Chloroflexi bacterium]|nr:hypothetical protein [Chloroflexota bacterium]
MSKQKLWWENIPAQIGGDLNSINIGTIGGDARNVNIAAGQNIQQTIQDILGAPTPNDKKTIEKQVADLNAALAKLHGQVDANTAKMAEFQIKLLGGELTKTDEKETPSATTITSVGDWLMDNVPQIAEAVIGLFATPAVGKVVGKAGEVAIKWVRQRFGGASAPA